MTTVFRTLSEPWVQFTTRQITYLCHLRAGADYAQIAEVYGVSPVSVRMCVRGMRAVLDCHRLHELVSLAADDGIPAVALPLQK